MKRVLLIVAGLIIANVVFAQKQTTYYLKNNGSYVDSRDGADYIRVFSAPDSGSTFYNFSEFYLNGKTKTTGKSSKTEYLLLQGNCTRYYPSGKMQESGTYLDNTIVGDISSYYPNGTLYNVLHYPTTTTDRELGFESDNYLMITCNDSTGKPLLVNGNGYFVSYNKDFKKINEEGPAKEGLHDGVWKGSNDYMKNPITFEETYREGKLIAGKSKSKDGDVVTYTKKSSPPGYPGGISKFYSFLGENIRYPKESRQNNIQGKVILSFVIEKDGKLADIKVTRHVSDDIDAEAVRVMQTSPKWLPGILYGRPVRVQYTVPIAFSLGY